MIVDKKLVRITVMTIPIKVEREKEKKKIRLYHDLFAKKNIYN